MRRERGEQLSWTSGFYFVICLFLFVQSGKFARHLISGRPYSKHQGYYASEDKPDFCFPGSYSLTDGDRNKINKIKEWELSSDGKQEVGSGRKEARQQDGTCSLGGMWGCEDAGCHRTLHPNHCKRASPTSVVSIKCLQTLANRRGKTIADLGPVD